jgi:RNA polymerase sigma-70 factor, ECF subfamily
MEKSKPTAGELWQALSGQLRAFIRSRVENDADADDLLQDVFVQVVDKLYSVRQTDRIQSWVYQIARNAVVAFYRRKGPAHEPVDVVTDENGVDTVDGNLNAALGHWLASMVTLLPHTFQDALRMYELDGRSQLEIAAQLRISLSAAKSRIQRGRRELAKLLRSSCELELDRRGNVIACQPKHADGCPEVSCECPG